MPINAPPRKLKLEDCGSEASLGYIVSVCKNLKQSKDSKEGKNKGLLGCSRGKRMKGEMHLWGGQRVKGSKGII